MLSRSLSEELQVQGPSQISCGISDYRVLFLAVA